MKDFFSKTILFFLNSNVFISICAYSLTYSAYHWYQIPPNWNILNLVFLATFIIYNIARLFPLYFDENTDLVNDNWLMTHKKIILLLTILCILMLLYLTLFITFLEFYYLAHLGILSLLYSFPKIKPLRTIPYLKIFLIIYVWVSVSIILPIINEGLEVLLKLPILLFTLQIALFLFAITLPFDIRDKEADLRQKIKTLPQNIGNKNIIYWSIFILGVSSLIAIVQQPEKIIYENILFLLTLLAIYKSKDFKSNWYYLGILDGTVLLKSLVIIL